MLRPQSLLRALGSENGIRAGAAKRTFSGGAMSTAGPVARGALLGLVKPCSKLKGPLLRCSGDRLRTPGPIVVPATSTMA